MFNNVFENCAVYEIMWKKYCRAGHATDDNMAFAHCIPLVKHTHSVCVIIIALPLQ